MRRSLLWIGVFGLAGVFPAAALGSNTRDVPEPPSPEIVVADSKGYPHLAILPEAYEDSSKRWPLLLFLHGGGLRGAPPERFRETELWKIAGKNDFPFLFLVPRCPAGEFWSNEKLLAFLADARERYRIEPRRVYLTGLSMGGFGAWALGAARPDLFAAIAPICGGGETSEVCRLKRTPVWAFHGAKDEITPVEGSRALVRALKRCGGNVRLTVYPEASHDAWTETYRNPELYQWFLKQEREGK